MRYSGSGCELRIVVEDLHLDGKHFLEKGSVVVIRAVHFDENIWGADLH